MKGNPWIVSVGNAQARAETPKEWWGAKDWEAEAKAQELGQPLDRVPVAQAAHLLPGGFSLFGERRRERDQRREADRVLERFGIGRRR